MPETITEDEWNVHVSLHTVEEGDKVVINDGSGFGSWAMEAYNKREVEINGSRQTWMKLKGDWDGAKCKDIYHDHETGDIKLAQFQGSDKDIRVRSR
jgi:hypothetical protein